MQTKLTRSTPHGYDTSWYGGASRRPISRRLGQRGISGDCSRGDGVLQLGQPRAAGHALRRPAVHEPVSASSRTGLRVSKMEIEKRRPETGRGSLPTWRRVEPHCASRDQGTGPNLQKCRGLYTASPETILAGWAYRIRTGLCRLVGRFETSTWLGSKFAALLSNGITTRKDWISCAERASLLAVVERHRRSRDRAPPSFRARGLWW